MQTLVKLTLIALAVSAAATAAFAQAQVSSADLKGRVVDQTDALLPGVTITITNVETGSTRSVVTDERGEYRAPLLPPGVYEIKAALQGFSTQVRRGLQLTVGQTANIHFKLQVAGAAPETVVIMGEAPLIEIEKTQQADTIDEKRIDNLPINGRNYLDYTLLTPGVTDASTLVTFAPPQTPTSGLSVAGQPGRNNNVTVDGADNNDYAVGAVRSTLSQEAVKEFQINKSNFSAEFGRSSGGLINIVTKSGTNELRGTVFAFLRNRKLDARNPFAFGPRPAPNAPPAPVSPPFTRVQSGFTLGGPIKKDKTFYFISYEGQGQRESQFVTFELNPRLLQPTPRQLQLLNFAESTATTDPRMRVILAGLRGFVNFGLTTTSRDVRGNLMYPHTFELLELKGSVFPFKNTANTASLKIDHQLSANDQLSGRYNFTHNDASGLNFGGLKAPSRGSRLALQDHALVLAETHIFNPKMVNEARFQFSQRYFNSTPADPFGPAIDISSIAQLGHDFFIPSVRQERRFQWVDNFLFTRGRHDFKVGADINHLPFYTDTRVFFGGRFLFAGIPFENIFDRLIPGSVDDLKNFLAASGRSDLIPNVSARITPLQAFNLGLPVLYQQGFGNPSGRVSAPQLAFYVHDGFRATSHLHVDLGLRYDYELQPKGATQFLPKGLHRDKNNFGPRVGFSWDPFKTGKTVVRGGYGIFYAPVYQAVTFIGRVLDGSRIVQLLAPLPGVTLNGQVILPPLIPPQIFQLALSRLNPNDPSDTRRVLFNRPITEQDLARFGLRVGETPPAIFTAHPDVVNPYSHQASFGIEREVVTNLSVAANYIINRGVHLLRGRNSNLMLRRGTNGEVLRDPVLHVPLQTTIDPRYVQINLVESSGNSIYHGFTLAVNKRYSRHSQFLIAYTLAKAIDDTTDLFTVDLHPRDQLNLRQERGLSSTDQRQRLVVSAIFDSPFKAGAGQPVLSRIFADFTLAPIFTYGSGRPFNLLFGDDINGDTNFTTDRPIMLDDQLRPILHDGEPIYAGRNTGRGPNFMTWDVRIAKRMKFANRERLYLEAIFEAFNLFNRVNFSGINPYVGEMPIRALGGSFRVGGRREALPTDPLGFTSAFAPRQLQVALKLNF
jgi:hypothetical protein